MKLTRRYQFSASHRLALPSLSLQENLALFGKCANPYGHGHNYSLELTVRGEVDPETGRVVNPAKLDEHVREHVVSAFDHKDLNNDVQDFADRIPTSENLTRVVSERLTRSWPFENIQLAGIRIEETKRNIFEFKDE